MVKTDVCRREYSVPIRCTIILFVMMLYLGGLNAQSNALACNDQVHVSLDENCMAIITPDIILEGEEWYPAPYNNMNNYKVLVTTPNGVPITSVGSGNSGFVITETGTYIVSIQEIYSGVDNYCWGTLIVEDKIAPQITSCPCPIGNYNPKCVLPMTCDDLDDILDGHYLDDILLPSYEDCSPVTITFDDQIYDNGACYKTKVKRKYIFTDASGNKSESCYMEYTVEPIDLYYDIHHPEALIFLPCGASFSMEDIYDYFYDIKYNELIVLAHTPAEKKEVEKIADEYAGWHSYPTIHGIPIWNSLCNLTVLKSDVIVPACEACEVTQKVVRTWTYYDWCTGETKDHIQIITNGDLDGPDIWAADISKTVDPWGCDATFYMPPPEQLSDACSDHVTYEIEGPPGISVWEDPEYGYQVEKLPKGNHTFYYHAFDCCYNKTTVAITVSIKDATPPTAIASQDLVISLAPTSTGEGIGKLFAESVDAGSHDGCGPVKLEVRREVDYCDLVGNTTYNNDGHLNDYAYDYDNGEFVRFCCADLTDAGIDEDDDGVIDYTIIKVWLRVWDDGNMDGIYGNSGDNYNETWANVRVEDKVPPTILCPPDITVDCDVSVHDLYRVGEAKGYNTCGDAEVDYEDLELSYGECGYGHFKRKWYIVGQPTSYCLQNIYVEEPDQNAIDVFFPEDMVIDCTDDLDDNIPYWNAQACNLLAYSLESDTFYFEEGACFKILNYWTVIDWCIYDPLDPWTGGQWQDVQVIKIIDDIAPEFPECEETVMIEANDFGDVDGDGVTCENTAVLLTQMADDLGDCASDWLKWTVQIDLWSDWTIEYTFSSTASPSSEFYIAPSSSGELVKVVLPDDIPGSMHNHRVVWKVSDGCGNNRSCTQNFMVVDKKSPTPYCVNVSSALMDNGQVELWACDFDLGSFDNCTSEEDLRFTFTSASPDIDPMYNPATNCSSRVFSCDDIVDDDGQSTPIEATVYVWDEKDNYDFCTVYLTLVDNQGVCGSGSNGSNRIAGQFRTESGEELAQISVELNSAIPNFPQLSHTNQDGFYAFNNNPMAADYQIRAISDSDYLNGVSTLDLLLIQKHILGVGYLDGPYNMIAADINNDEKISAIDLLELRKLILGISPELPNSDSWRFPIFDQQMGDTEPWPFSEEIMILDFNQEMMGNDFIGVKVGDVNGTAEANLGTNNIDNRSLNIWNLFIAKSFEDPSGNVIVPVYTKENRNLAGFQFALSHLNMELIDVLGEAIDMESYNSSTSDDGITSFSWNKSALQKLDAEEVLMFLVFDQSGQIALSNDLASEAYIGENFETEEIVLNFSNDEFENILFQNEPNPFIDYTVVEFSLAQDNYTSLKIYDIGGKVLKIFEGHYTEGFNTIKINKKDIQGTGLLYYTLESGDFAATKKMILMD